MSDANWIAADYDGKQLRNWMMQGASVTGQGQTACDDLSAVARELRKLPDLPILLADMSGSLPTGDCPSVPAPAGLILERGSADGRPIWFAQGVAQAEPQARLYGQTALVAGLLAADPQFDGVICSVGRHNHWIRVSANEICHVHGYLSGELLEWISSDGAEAGAAAPDAFRTAVDNALSRPHRAHGRFLSLKAATGSGAAELAGLLIGCELADSRPYWLGETVAVTGNGPLAELYAQALGKQGVSVRRPDRDAALLAGLHGAWKTLPDGVAGQR